MRIAKLITTVLPALLVVSLSVVARAAPIASRDFTAPGKFVWLGDYRLHIHCVGEGSPAVVFDSGLGGTTLDWSRVQPIVAQFTRACVYDRAGYGWSDGGPPPRHSGTIVSELAQLLGYAGVAAPYVLVGHSFGGFNVRLFANRFPDRIAGLVLVDSSHEDQFERFAAADLTNTAPQGGTFFVGNHDRIPEGLPDDLRPLAQIMARDPDAVTALYSELRHFRYSAHLVSAASELPDVPLVVITHATSFVEQLGRPGRMAALWLAMQEDLAGRTSLGQLVVAPTREHYVQLFEPQVVVEAIRSVVAMSRTGTGCTLRPAIIEC